METKINWNNIEHILSGNSSLDIENFLGDFDGEQKTLPEILDTQSSGDAKIREKGFYSFSNGMLIECMGCITKSFRHVLKN